MGRPCELHHPLGPPTHTMGALHALPVGQHASNGIIPHWRHCVPSQNELGPLHPNEQHAWPGLPQFAMSLHLPSGSQVKPLLQTPWAQQACRLPPHAPASVAADGMTGAAGALDAAPSTAAGSFCGAPSTGVSLVLLHAMLPPTAVRSATRNHFDSYFILASSPLQRLDGGPANHHRSHTILEFLARADHQAHGARRTKKAEPEDRLRQSIMDAAPKRAYLAARSWRSTNGRIPPCW